MDAIICPECGANNPIEAAVCEQCNANLTSVKTIADTANEHYNEALSLAHSGRLDEALGQLDAALALASENPNYHNLMGTLYAQKGLYSEAIRAWERCLALDGEMDKAYRNIDKARRMEEDTAEEQRMWPYTQTALVASVLACVFFISTLGLGIRSFLKNRSYNAMAQELTNTRKEADDWKFQFQALNTRFPAEKVDDFFKSLTQAQTQVAERDHRINILQDQMKRASDNTRNEMTDIRDQLKQAEEENKQIQSKLQQIDVMKNIILEAETEIDNLRKTMKLKEEDLRIANARIATHRDNLVLAQENVKDLKESREEAIRQIKQGTEKQLQEMQGETLQMRDEIARFEQRAKNHDYADGLVIDALNNIDRTDFQNAMKNMEMALERVPDHPAALYLKQAIGKILDDPVEQEIRRKEIVDRESLKEEKRKQLVQEYVNGAEKHIKSGSFGEAIDLAERTLSLNPEDPKDVEKAQRILNQAQEKNREIALLILEAKQEISDKNFKNAAEIVKTILKQSPSNAEARRLLEHLE